jgi:predicted transcriptional regulator of viral defense system
MTISMVFVKSVDLTRMKNLKNTNLNWRAQKGNTVRYSKDKLSGCAIIEKIKNGIYFVTDDMTGDKFELTIDEFELMNSK